MNLAIFGLTANDVWRDALAQVLSGAQSRPQTGRNGDTREVMHVSLAIGNPKERWVTARLPPMNPAFAIAEVVWIVQGRNDASFLNYFNRQLPKYAGSGDVYHGAYGFRLREHFGIDQLQRAFSALLHNSATRQAVLQFWDPRADMPTEDGREASADIPCNICALLKIREGKLEWTQIMRSNDIFRGTPYNLLQFTSIQEIVSGWLGVEVGTYYQLSDSLHIYETDTCEVSATGIVDGTLNSDTLAYPKDESDAAFQELADRIDHLVDDDLTEAELRRISQCDFIPVAHQNFLRILTAEAARRRSLGDLSDEFAGACTNTMLSIAWQQWKERVQHRR